MKYQTDNMKDTIVYIVVQSEKYGDWRVNKFVNGKWVNQRDGNWTQEEAEEKAEYYRDLTKRGISTMSDED